MNWRAWFGLRADCKATSSFDTSSEAQEQPLEWDRANLSKLWLSNVLQRYEQLEKWAREVEIVMSDERSAMLFKQICLFNDVLWSHYLIPDAISRTGRIGSDKIADYIEQFRQTTMQMVNQDKRLPQSWRNWDTYGTREEWQIDIDFYTHGTLPKSWEEDYHKVQSVHGMKLDGTSWELLGRFHLRVWQTLNIFKTFESGYIGEVYALWSLQSSYTIVIVEEFRHRIIPVN